MNRTIWPKVIDEDKTLDKILEGYSIARYGDGELKLCSGGDCISQVQHPDLKAEMLEILKNKNKDCIVGIPNYVESPKKWFWDKVCTTRRYMNMLDYNTPYYSQFITRPDSAPWINRPDFWNKMESLWKDQDVILVAGSFRSLTKEKMKTMKSVTLVEGSYRDSYVHIDRLEKEILALPHHRVLLCIGATATCLAARLARKGRHALDMGHIGMFWEKRIAE